MKTFFSTCLLGRVLPTTLCLLGYACRLLRRAGHHPGGLWCLDGLANCAAPRCWVASLPLSAKRPCSPRVKTKTPHTTMTLTKGPLLRSTLPRLREDDTGTSKRSMGTLPHGVCVCVWVWVCVWVCACVGVCSRPGGADSPTGCPGIASTPF
jgi:hypothetical protein